MGGEKGGGLGGFPTHLLAGFTSSVGYCFYYLTFFSFSFGKCCRFFFCDTLIICIWLLTAWMVGDDVPVLFIVFFF